VVEFSLIVVLLVFLLFAVLQVAALFYVRSVAGAAAADGARYAANADVPPGEGADRAGQLIRQGLGAGMADRLPCTGGQLSDPASGMSIARVRCRGRVRSLLVPIGAFVTVDVTGQSLRDRP